MASAVSTALRRSVIERAQGKCEYCQLHQNFSIYTHEIDHVIATKHGGRTLFENLALSCLSCNRHKGSDLTSFDPLTLEMTRLFDPRSWTDSRVKCDRSNYGHTIEVQHTICGTESSTLAASSI